jgi:hypothetical protein
LAEGRTLADLVASGWRADEAEAKRIAKELLGVLDYLGSRRPAVTHRCGAPEQVFFGLRLALYVWKAVMAHRISNSIGVSTESTSISCATAAWLKVISDTTV